MQLKRLDSCHPDFPQQWQLLLTSVTEPNNEVTRVTESILAAVRTRGDEALVEYTNRLDQRQTVSASELEIPVAKLERALEGIPQALRRALEQAASRIREYHARQVLTSWHYQDDLGNTLGQQVTPLARVGVYVPGGQAAYPSSVLMNVIPARVAGVSEIVMVVPTPSGESNQVVLAAAAIAGVDRVFSVGGAQAVAALAYGTETVPKVDKIVGPGNIYVATAKRQVFGVVGIDMIAGPSEILVLSDGKGSADWVAMDLLAQAEHDQAARAILICPCAEFIKAVATNIRKVLPELERADIARRSLAANGALILVKDLDEAVQLANQLAPEHLELAVNAPQALLPRIRNAGAIFMGCHAAEVLGDYCAGPNHVLPTAGTAKFSSPLGVYDFQKRSSVLRCTEESASALAETAATLARSEGLTAHARAAEYRRKP